MYYIVYSMIFVYIIIKYFIVHSIGIIYTILSFIYIYICNIYIQSSPLY